MFPSRTLRVVHRISWRACVGAWLVWRSVCPGVLMADSAPLSIGVGRMDVNPAGPIRLTGYVARKKESEGVEQRLWAKAIALGTDAEGASILVTVDNCGVGARVVDAVAARLKQKAGIPRERFAVCSSHTHSGPMSDGFAANIFGEDLPSDQQERIHRYTAELTDRIEAVALAALADRSPGRLRLAHGQVGFATNRRTAGGPTDRRLSALIVTDPSGRLRAVLVNYACHCTTLGSEVVKVHGDWAGDAQEAIEQAHPGIVALVSIGCGADSNPSPRGGTDFGRTLARMHGRSIAAELEFLLKQGTELTALPQCRYREFPLPFMPLPDRAGWEERARQSGIVGYHARRNLQRLDRGETLPTTLPYRVQNWSFGEGLSMVFLAGEVVVDYALRMQREYDPERLWINAYANDVPCYIPSKRILAEGGYEAESSLWYYDRPARLAPETEDLIHAAVLDLVPAAFRSSGARPDLPPMKSPRAARDSLRPRAGLEVHAAATEPQIDSPVAIDFGADGRLWVCEMADYPSGLDGKGKPGGRVSVLKDRDGDGVYEESVVFASGFPYPTGLMAWGDGVLICAAPDILWAHDTDGDGRADRIETLFSGFATHNYQARVSGLRWGLDGWVYGSGSLFGGKIRSVRTGLEVEATGRDFRFKPDTGEFEALAGVSQQGRTRDDFGTQYGNDNSTLLWQFPLEDRLLRRNPHVTPPPARVSLARGADANRVYPISRTLERFNDPQSANHLTSGCGPEIYRDSVLGAEFEGNAFVCEPVHNLVRRSVFQPEGIINAAVRAAEEQDREFLASSDNWFRPVEVRTGPDGALWVVDMNRFVIEHPRWIPADRLKELDPRAGAGTGRIWRVAPAGLKPSPSLSRDYTRMKVGELASLLDTSNGVVRDLVHRELLRRAGPTPLEGAVRTRIETVAQSGRTPGARAQAIAVLAGCGVLSDRTLVAGLLDSDPRVRRVAVRFSEMRSGMARALVPLSSDPDAGVRCQLALTLGTLPHGTSATIFEALAKKDAADPWIRAALLSSLPDLPDVVLPPLGAVPKPGERELMEGAIRTWTGMGDQIRLGRALGQLVSAKEFTAGPDVSATVLQLYAALLKVRADENGSRETRKTMNRVRKEVVPAVSEAFEARRLSEPASLALLQIWGAERRSDAERVKQWVRTFDAELSAAVHAAVRDGIARQSSLDLARALLAGTAVRPVRWRNEAIELMLGRREWTAELLSMIERRELGVGELMPSQRQRVLGHTDAALRARGEALFGGLRGGDRASVVRRFTAAVDLAGDETRGMREFDRLCASCHRVRGHGFAVGPDLSPYRSKPAADFLLAVLDPNSAIEPKFTAYTVELREGRSLTGILRNETSAGLELVQAGGVVERIARSAVTGITPQAQSLMPEGLEVGLEPQALADLLAWLRGGTVAAFGSADAASASASLKALSPAATKVTARGGRLTYPGWIGARPMSYCRQSAGENRLAWESFAPSSDAGRLRFRFPVAMGMKSQPAGTFQMKVQGGTAVGFNVSLEDEEWTDAAGAVRIRYTVRERNGEDSCGPLEIEIPAAGFAPGSVVRFEITGSESASQRWVGLYETTVVEGLKR